MKIYKLTAYEQTGKLIAEETVTALNDDEAKEKGQALLEEKALLDQTHRFVSPDGKLLLFHS
ncbi:YhzD-like protein [Planomicrobium soli]|uniref:YhzD-like protein n=1 Tax=Planomicrobium soli TaxID=1176648 RepID=A0A2P8G9G6_9BACL|nr:YhzD family protein [Planomicrobium soli]PSL30619.1 YhzD-like protein [Planomicrobium soli]